MQLKGSMLDRIPLHKREKMENTLKRMEEVRRNDDMRLRGIIQAKKEWAVNERKIGFDVIDKLDSQIEASQIELGEKIEELQLLYSKKIEEIKGQQEKVRTQITKLDGVLLVLNDLITESAKQDEELKKQREAEAARKSTKAVKSRITRKSTSKAKTPKDIKKK